MIRSAVYRNFPKTFHLVKNMSSQESTMDVTGPSMVLRRIELLLLLLFTLL